MRNELGKLVSIAKGKKHSISQTPSQTSKRVLSIVDLRNDENIVYTDDKKGVEVTPEDIMIAWDGANAGTIGYGKSGYIGSTIARIRFKEKNKYNTNFVGAFLKTKFNYLRKTATGAAIPHISRVALESIKIPQFGLDEQNRIASILDRVEALITSRNTSLTQLDRFINSTYFDMFGPSHSDYEKWPLVQISELTKKHKGAMRTGPFGSNLKHGEFTSDGEVAVLGIDNAVTNKFTWGERRYITRDKYKELKQYTIYPGDVIVTIMGTIGRSAVIPDDIPLAINTKHLAAITLNTKEANPYFISYSIHSSPYIIGQFRSRTRGAIMNGLNLGIIKETKIRKPPIELQNKFSEILKKINLIKACYEQNLNELESLYGALSQKAFKGELDVSKVPIDVVIAPKPAQLKLTGHAPTITVINRFNKTTFVNLLKEYKNESFNFNSLLEKIEEKEFDNLPKYEEVKELIFNLLEENEPFLTQSFDEEKNEIVMSVNA